MIFIDGKASMTHNPTCLVIGAGDDTGGAVGRAFAAEGLTACLVRRERHADKLEALAQSICDAGDKAVALPGDCLLYTSPSPRDATLSRMPSSA